MRLLNQVKLRIWKAFPYSTAFVTCYLKGSIADGIAQVKLKTPKNTTDTQSQMAETKGFDTNSASSYDTIDSDNWFNRINWMRNWRFAMFSGLYCGCIQHFVYNMIYPTLLLLPTLPMRMPKIFIDSFVHVPFGYFPAYFVMRSTFLGGTPMDGIKQYLYQEKWKVLISYWKLWIPVFFCVFYVLPYEVRVGTIGAVNILWLVILSHLSPMEEEKTEIKALEANSCNKDIHVHYNC